MTTVLTAADLFQPALSGVGPFGSIPSQPSSSTWLGRMIEFATIVQLPTTSWQPGGPERTMLAIQAVSFAMSDVNISLMVQGGFLQTAANGTVTYTTLQGQTVTVPVTPDPSDPAQNPTGALGWLDLLSNNIYNVERLTPSRASGDLAFANLSGSTIGPYAQGSYHAASALNGATYSNEDVFSIPSSVIAGTGGVVTAVAPIIGFGAPRTVITTQSASGVATNSIVYLAIPVSTGVGGLQATFAAVTAVLSTTQFEVNVGSSVSTYAGGGNVYLCSTSPLVADLPGRVGDAPPLAVNIAVTQNPNVFVANLNGWSASGWESNQALQSRDLLSLANRSPNGPSQSYEYYALTAAQIYAALPEPYIFTNGRVTASVSGNPQTGIVAVVVASVSPQSTAYGQPVTPGCAQNPITGVSNGNPCVISCAHATGISSGGTMSVTITGTSELPAGVAGTWTGTYVTSSAFSIPVDTTLAGSYTGGGQVEGGDLGAVDLLIQDTCVPDAVTAITSSALAMPITVTATVAVPQAYVNLYRAAVQQQLLAQTQSYGIGGSTETSPARIISWNDYLEALGEAGITVIGQASYVKAVQQLVISTQSQSASGSTQYLQIPGAAYQPILVSAIIAVVGV